MAGFWKMLKSIVETRLIKRAVIKIGELKERESLSLKRTSKNNAMSGPNVNEAILSPTSTRPSEIFTQ